MEFLPYKYDPSLILSQSILPWLAKEGDTALTASDLYLLLNLYAIRGPWGRLDIDLKHFYERVYGRGTKGRSGLQGLKTELAGLEAKLKGNPYLRLKWKAISEKEGVGKLELGTLQTDGEPYVILAPDELCKLFNLFPVERGQLERAVWVYLYIKSRLWGHEYSRKVVDENGNARLEPARAYGYWIGMDAIREASGLNYKTVLTYTKQMIERGLLSTLQGGLNKRTIFIVGNDPQDIAAIQSWAESALKDNGNSRWGLSNGKNFRW